MKKKNRKDSDDGCNGHSGPSIWKRMLTGVCNLWFAAYWGFWKLYSRRLVKKMQPPEGMWGWNFIYQNGYLTFTESTSKYCDTVTGCKISRMNAEYLHDHLYGYFFNPHRGALAMWAKVMTCGSSMANHIQVTNAVWWTNCVRDQRKRDIRIL